MYMHKPQQSLAHALAACQFLRSSSRILTFEPEISVWALIFFSKFPHGKNRVYQWIVQKKILCQTILYTHAVNFINVLRAQILRTKVFSASFFTYMQLKKSSWKDVRTKNSCKIFWWNWHTCSIIFFLVRYIQGIMDLNYWIKIRWLFLSLFGPLDSGLQ